tara:strand:+ start:1355 stop:1603 length:249 start_codon:yes stop_codon:yes gene_type:complete
MNIKLFFNKSYSEIIDVLFKQLRIHKETEGTNPQPIAGNGKFTAKESFQIKEGEMYDISLWGQIDEDTGYNSANLSIKKSNK